MNDVVLVAGSILTMIGGTGYFTFLFAKSKYQQEVKKLEVEVLQAKKEAETTDIENDSKVIGQYKDALNDLPIRYEQKYRHIEEMSNQVEKLFEKKEAILKQEIEYHKKTAALYKKMYDDKVKEFNKYKKEHP
jgi:uncharacterized protein HemX